MRQLKDVLPNLPRRTTGQRALVSAEKKSFAKKLRSNPTAASDQLWQRLRRKSLGAKFRRRAVLYGWIPDFWCPSARIAIEIDYPSDQLRSVEHKRRDGVLMRHSITVKRIAADRVYLELDQVVREIEQALTHHTAPQRSHSVASRTTDG